MSQCDRILQVLKDERWHTPAEIHQHVGPLRLNSRVSELRARGYLILGEHVPGQPSGPDGYRYRLAGGPAAVSLPAPAVLPARADNATGGQLFSLAPGAYGEAA